MSRSHFGETFAGYCVIHAPFVAPERRAWFESELPRVGVKDFIVVETRPTQPHDERLTNYEGTRRNGPVILSVADGYKRCIDIARARGWPEVAIFEDDVVFRPGFEAMWNEVEPEVARREWDVLFLYRWRSIPIVELRRRTRLARIDSNICLHAFVLRSSSYDRFQQGLDHAIREGSALDTGTLHRHLGRHDGRILATTRNLAGQMGGFKSPMSSRTRDPSEVEMFRVRRATDLTWHLRALKSLMRRRGWRLSARPGSRQRTPRPGRTRGG